METPVPESIPALTGKPTMLAAAAWSMVRQDPLALAAGGMDVGADEVGTDDVGADDVGAADVVPVAVVPEPLEQPATPRTAANTATVGTERRCVTVTSRVRARWGLAERLPAQGHNPPQVTRRV
jgi:hypothetical protein